MLRIAYEAPQGRRVNAIGAYFTHGPIAGRFCFTESVYSRRDRGATFSSVGSERDIPVSKSARIQHRRNRGNAAELESLQHAHWKV